MLLDQVFEKFEHIKYVFVRKDGKLKKVRRIIPMQDLDRVEPKKSLFPISKERK